MCSWATGWSPPVSALLVFTSGALLVGLFLKRTGRSVFPAVLVLCVVVGGLRTALMTDPTAELARYHTQSTVQVEGLALDDAGPAGSAMRFPVRVERVFSDGGWTEVVWHGTRDGEAECAGCRETRPAAHEIWRPAAAGRSVDALRPNWTSSTIRRIWRGRASAR